MSDADREYFEKRAGKKKPVVSSTMTSAAGSCSSNKVASSTVVSTGGPSATVTSADVVSSQGSVFRFSSTVLSLEEAIACVNEDSKVEMNDSGMFPDDDDQIDWFEAEESGL